MFSCEFFEISKITFFTEHFRATGSIYTPQAVELRDTISLTHFFPMFHFDSPYKHGIGVDLSVFNVEHWEDSGDFIVNFITLNTMHTFF